MQAKVLKIHNYRSIVDSEIALTRYSVLAGENNAGKSNTIAAILLFYKQLKWRDSDSPQFETRDQECWVEISYSLEPVEHEWLQKEYPSIDNDLRLRFYVKTLEKYGNGKSREGRYFPYIDGEIADKPFPESKLGAGGLGRIIYIPAVSRLEDQVKLTGPSPFRELVGLVLGSSIGITDAFATLRLAFNAFERQLRQETQGGRSLIALEQEITGELSSWQGSFEIGVNQIEPAELVKNSVRPYVRDPHSGKPVEPDQLGSGHQRSIIFALLKLSSRYKADQAFEQDSSRSDTPLSLTWLLFEEPETFLHPIQIDSQYRSLVDLAKLEGHQVTVTTHNPAFLSRSMEDLSSLVRVHRQDSGTQARQVTQEDLRLIFQDNQTINAAWKAARVGVAEDDLTLEMESIKYSLWLNPQRAAAFFARKVVIVEGPTEVAVINYLID
ncbi:ATP-dependent endonuclease, partial [Frankia sp. AiPa1]|uniref:ATP-dependent nuclease n=1 Tax=Frankia sp. AiPa1 TaxID=573492 RepID=UPI00202AC7EB